MQEMTAMKRSPGEKWWKFERCVQTKAVKAGVSLRKDTPYIIPDQSPADLLMPGQRVRNVFNGPHGQRLQHKAPNNIHTNIDSLIKS